MITKTTKKTIIRWSPHQWNTTKKSITNMKRNCFWKKEGILMLISAMTVWTSEKTSSIQKLVLRGWLTVKMRYSSRRIAVLRKTTTMPRSQSKIKRLSLKILRSLLIWKMSCWRALILAFTLVLVIWPVILELEMGIMPRVPSKIRMCLWVKFVCGLRCFLWLIIFWVSCLVWENSHLIFFISIYNFNSGFYRVLCEY